MACVHPAPASAGAPRLLVPAPGSGHQSGAQPLDPTVLDSNTPKVYEQMAMPVRMTDNFNCLSDRVDQDGLPHPGFCFEDFDGNGVADLCASSYGWTNSKGELKNICVTEDGRLLNGQTGSSRTRMMLDRGLHPCGRHEERLDGDRHEETKGLGAGHTDLEPLDIGKDTMYHSFDLSQPDVAAPGHMLNLPETDPLSDPENPWDDSVVLVALAPTATALAGELVTLTADAIYDGFETLLYSWDLDNDGSFETEGLTVTFPATGSAQAVALKVCELGGRCDIDQGWVNPDPNVPRVWRVAGEPMPAKVGTTVAFSGKLNIPGRLELADAEWTWGDGSGDPAALPAELQGNGASVATGTHAFAAAGIYPVTLAVTDAEGDSGYDVAFFPVYDPAAGRITGDAAIEADGHAYAFAFDAQYDKKGGYLKGQVTVNVDRGAAKFQATALEYLVVEPDGMAHLSALGTFAGQGGYRLLLTLRDGDRSDVARVRISHAGAGRNGHLLYDSQPATPFGGDATTPVSEGNVTLHLK